MRAEDDDGHRRRPAQRQGDVPEVLPLGRAIDAGGLVIVLGDRHDAGDVDDGGEAHALPHVDQRHREQGKIGIGEPAGPLDAEQRPDASLIMPWVGCISTVKVMPTPTVETSTGKNTTERR